MESYSFHPRCEGPGRRRGTAAGPGTARSIRTISPRRTPAWRPWLLPALSIAATLALSLYLATSGHEVDADVYLMGAQHAFRPDLYQVPLGRSGLLFTYTPFAALLFVPLQRTLTLIPAQGVWTAVNVAALVCLLATALRRVRPAWGRTEVLRWALQLSLPALLLDPVFLTIGLGQVNLALAAAVLWDLAGERDDGSGLPLGVATGLAAAIKLTPLIFVPYLLLTRRVRGAVVCMVTFVACGAVGFAASPASSLAFWSHDVLDPHRTGALQYISDQNLVSILDRFNHGAVRAGVLWTLVLLVGAGGMAVAVAAQRRSSDLLGVLACASTGLLVSPVTWAHHMVWIVPAAIWLYAAPDRPRHGVLWAAGAVVLFWVSPLWWVPRSWRLPGRLELHEHGWQLLAGSSFALATMAFLAGVAAVVLVRSRRGWPVRLA